ncbi:MAG TPA: D-xylose ABC transporter ATP-binding protein [Ruminococcaceae bacterium]|nr:D-xylose ABC transporter ATP-binding protein [Oscillospiraceae bacterium]
MEAYKISLRHISKSFPGVKALSDIDFDVRPGTVHVLMGENGAGKSTMMKIINGIYHPDEGEIQIDGRPVTIKTPQEAARLGIAMIYQELYFVPEFTIGEYLFMAKEPRRLGCVVDWKKLYRQARELIEQEGVPYDPRTKIKNLSVSDIQIIEIMKATYSGAQIIIMDEPTSSISNADVDRLFAKIEELKKRGITILYISHKLDEIFRIADYITVIRDGQVIETRPAGEFDSDTIIAKMVGRPLDNVYPETEACDGEVCFTVEDLSGPGFRKADFDVRRGEIVGFAGLVGAGRTEMMSALVGLTKKRSGRITLDGQELELSTVETAKRQGVVMVSEDRQRYGIVAVRSVLENSVLANLGNLSNLGVLMHHKEREAVGGFIKRLSIRTPGQQTLMQSLSGGNQQKVVLSKWLMTAPRVLILDEPTRGIDVGAKYEIYCLIREMARQGICVILVSSELPELIGMCNRVYVVHEGNVAGQLSGESMNQENIMRLATGGQGNAS